MIRIVETEVRGRSSVGEFQGRFQFGPGLQVVAADNHFGKSLAATTVAWCLGLETMFGLSDNDSARFPVAVREAIDLDGQTDIPVMSSSAVLTLERQDGSRARLTREIKGDPSTVVVAELAPSGEVLRESKMLARRRTMKDATAGLQHFLFEWLGMPRTNVMTYRGDVAELYLENIAPLLFVDQNEGWTDLQTLQVHRYGLLEVSPIAVEYLLGADSAIEARFKRQELAARHSQLKAEAAAIADDIVSLAESHGWVIKWSHVGSVESIRERWSKQSFSDVLAAESVDIDASLRTARDRAEVLRQYLATGDLDEKSSAAASEVSQRVVELKEERHGRRDDLRTLRRQREEQQQLLAGLESRLGSARDVLRLKDEGVGRLAEVECPTCHRSLDPASFNLRSQSVEAVQAHVEALDRDRKMLVANLASVDEQMTRVGANLAGVEEQFRRAARALSAVNQAVGPVREQLAKAATDLVATESQIESLLMLKERVAKLESRVETWISQAAPDGDDIAIESDLKRRTGVFARHLQTLLQALGHSGVLANPEANLHLDENYIPYLGTRRLRSLGSASDHSRLVAAYVLALAAAAREVSGHHPGFVVLDEPLQQNPDEHHRQMFVEFLLSESARDLQVQTLVFTWLRENELGRLDAGGAQVHRPEGEHFLKAYAEPDYSDATSDGEQA